MFKIILLLIVSTFAETLTGFWGIDFGSSKEQAKKVMSAKKAVFVPKCSKDDFLMYSEAVFAGRNTKAICLYFNNDEFHTARVIFGTERYATISLYKEIKELEKDETKLMKDLFGYVQ